MIEGKASDTTSKHVHYNWLKVIGGRHADLGLVIVFTIATDVLIFLPSFADSVRAVFGLVFVFSMPGYALQAAILPNTKNITSVERVGISVGMSIVTVTLAAIFLNYAAFGIRLVPLAAFLSAFVFVSVVVAYIRRRSLAAKEGGLALIPNIFAVGQQLFPRSSSSINKLLTAAIITLVIVSSGMMISLIFAHKEQGFTEFYLLGSGNELNDYQTQLALGQQQHIIVNVTNHEGQNTAYRLVILLNDTGNRTVLYDTNLSLPDDQIWHGNLTLEPSSTGSNLREEFLLYKNNDSNMPYRELHLWVNVTTASEAAAPTATSITASNTSPTTSQPVTFTVAVTNDTGAALEKPVKIWHTTPSGGVTQDGIHMTSSGQSPYYNYQFTVPSWGKPGQRVYHAEFGGDASYVKSSGETTVHVA